MLTEDWMMRQVDALARSIAQLTDAGLLDALHNS